VEKGRIDEARKTLLFLRRGKADYNVNEDLNEMEAAWQAKLNAKKGRWIDCFRGRNLARTNVCIGAQSYVGFGISSGENAQRKD
jgi:hypothetical protein